jgi:DNA-binding LacI/PurR family transcriptional regulator
VSTARPLSRPTLEDVARAAGVSRATVSRVINGSTKVSPQVRRSVRSVIEELGFVPNTAARALVTQRTGTVALVVSEPVARMFADPFFETIVRESASELAAADVQLVLVPSSTPQECARFERFCAGRHVDGVLLLSLHEPDSLPAVLARVGLPVVLGGRPLAGAPTIPYVDVDNETGARLAVEHLLARGRTTIGTITGPTDTRAGIDRLTGYRAGLGRLPTRRSLMVPGDFTRAGGKRAMHRLLAQEPGIDAVFCASDLTALGAIDAATAAGLKVPDDIAIVGFDDLELARYSTPPLTTVRQPTEQLGREMARLLLSLIRGDDRPTHVLLPTRLVLRGSS